MSVNEAQQPAVAVKGESHHKHVTSSYNKDTAFTLKRWNLVAMWSWDVDCEVCAICRTPLMGKPFPPLFLLYCAIKINFF